MLDEKNFHFSQMMIWQRGTDPQQSQGGSNSNRSRAIKPDTLQYFQTFDLAQKENSTRVV